MTYIELQRMFESGTSSLDEVSERKLNSEDIFYWLNLGLIEFIKSRVQTLVQKNQSYTDDLSTLIVTDYFDITDYRFDNSDLQKVVISYKDGKISNAINNFLITEDTIPYNFGLETGGSLLLETSEYSIIENRYWYMVGENVGIISTGTQWPTQLINSVATPIVKIVDVVESTIENVTNKLNNSLSEHKLNRDNAKPIRVFCDDKIYLYTDGNYTISNYELIYIKKPNTILITADNRFDSYTDMPDHTHEEIVRNAIGKYLESLQIKNSTYPKETK
jgi:hypothetical protein